MAYDEKLAARLRTRLKGEKALTEIKMFGGLCFTLRGNMCCGVLKDELIVRVDPADADKFLSEPHTRPFDFTGRPMKNFLYIAAPSLKTPAGLKKWLRRGVTYASSLPPKA